MCSGEIICVLLNDIAWELLTCAIDAGCRPGSRSTFVPTKVDKTIDAPPGHIRVGGRRAREGGPTRGAQTGPAVSCERQPLGPGGRRRSRGKVWFDGLREPHIPFHDALGYGGRSPIGWQRTMVHPTKKISKIIWNDYSFPGSAVHQVKLPPASLGELHFILLAGFGYLRQRLVVKILTDRFTHTKFLMGSCPGPKIRVISTPVLVIL